MSGKPKVLAIGNFTVHRFAHHWQGIRLGLDALYESGQIGGYEVFDFRAECPHAPGGVVLSDAPAQKAIADYRPDVILFGVQDAMTDAVLARAKAVDAYTALWFCDLRHPASRDLSGRLNLLALTNAGYLSAYEVAWNLDTEHTVWLPQACLPRKAPEDPDPESACDILHIGSWGHPEFHRRRREVLSRLGACYDLTLYNPISDEEKADITARMPVLYPSAKVSIGISEDVAGYHSNRLFLATGHAGFYVCNAFRGMEQLYEPGREVETLPDSPFDLVCAFNRWLSPSSGKDRDRIRRAGFCRAQAEHTYPQRVAELWGCVRKRR